MADLLYAYLQQEQQQRRARHFRPFANIDGFTDEELRARYRFGRQSLEFMHQSIPAAPIPPPRADPRALALSLSLTPVANSRGWG